LWRGHRLVAAPDLAHPDSARLTGQVIHVNGGVRTAR